MSPAALFAAAGVASDNINVDLGGGGSAPGTSVTFFLVLGALSILPAMLLMTTSFTKIIVVLGITRNALGLQGIPPNQVLVGIALFLSLFIMAPTLDAMNTAGLQPWLHGSMTASQAFTAGMAPLRDFMLAHTGSDELKLMSDLSGHGLPSNPDTVATTTLIPAFMLSELKQAFIIGFVILVPFLVIDIVVSGALMALGMMMMPPVVVSLPFKLLLFIMVDGWTLIITNLVASYSQGTS